MTDLQDMHWAERNVLKIHHRAINRFKPFDITVTNLYSLGILT